MRAIHMDKPTIQSEYVRTFFSKRAADGVNAAEGTGPNGLMRAA
jgi:hypothetical protein